jgi:hypothetical protein
MTQKGGSTYNACGLHTGDVPRSRQGHGPELTELFRCLPQSCQKNHP